MIDLTFKRKVGAGVDFTEWGLDDDFRELESDLKRILSRSIDIIFSRDGANASLDIDTEESPGDLNVVCEIFINEFETYASCSTSLLSLIEDAAICVEDEDVKKMAETLRQIANRIDRLHAEP